MADTCLFVSVEIVLGLIGLVGLTAAVVEFILWVKYTDHLFGHRHERVRASPVVAAIWFLLGFAMLAMVYLVALERLE